MGVVVSHQVARRVSSRPRDPAEVLYDWFQNQYWSPDLYLTLANSENAFVELSDGKVLIYEMPTPQHQGIVGNLYMALRAHVQATHCGKVFVAPLPVQLWRGKFREPDVMFYRSIHLARIGEQFAGPPDWVAEVLSSSTRNIDMLTKTGEYALAGVPEYWLIDPEMQRVTVYTLPENAETYHLSAEYNVGEQVRAETLPGFTVLAGELFTYD
ncbi:MAG: Uma2 family endonuclease [Anaerolineae bacterium]|nr:Uma2 family endonuclease [Anaerolineae bacterium]